MPPKLPTAVLKARGSIAKDPQRYRGKTEPQPAGPLGDPPRQLTAKQKKIWRELEREIAPGVAGSSDRRIVQLTCVLCDKLNREDTRITAADAAQLRACLSALGMDPVARGRLRLGL